MSSFVALFASSKADVSESFVSPPLCSDVTIDVIDDCQVVIAEQRSSAHSDVRRLVVLAAARREEGGGCDEDRCEGPRSHAPQNTTT